MTRINTEVNLELDSRVPAADSYLHKDNSPRALCIHQDVPELFTARFRRGVSDPSPQNSTWE